MTSVAAKPSPSGASGALTDRPRQNWVIGPGWDLVLIIAAPLLAWLWSATVFRNWGSATVFAIFMVFNVAHHFPTWIRIYGDRDLLRRFRWSLILGPVLPFSLMLWVVYRYLSLDLPPSHLLFMFVMLNLWDPWHFLMQHYGFMRVYDRANSAPRQLASWMDYMISAAWFVFIMLAAVDWLCALLYELNSNHGIPLLMWLQPAIYLGVRGVFFALAMLATLVYGGYLVWCLARGYFVSPAKLLLLACMYPVMYLVYVPNALTESLLPGWDFPSGFATIGMVHVSQYLAIVWTYNRGLARRPERSRAGVFRDVFATGGAAMAALYVAACLTYGLMLSDQSPVFFQLQSLFASPTLNRLVVGLLLSLSFTSTITHYYYDGFIWKVRHKENRENLESSATGTGTLGSWWERNSSSSFWVIAGWQTLYFALPLGFLMFSFWGLDASSTAREPLRLARSASALPVEERAAGAERALAALDRQIGIERRMVSLRPKAEHYVYLAELLEARTRLEYDGLVSAGEGGQWERRRAGLEDASRQLRKALDLGGKFGHRENPAASNESLSLLLGSWQQELRRGGQLPSPLADRATPSR